MTGKEHTGHHDDPQSVKVEDYLSFKPVGRVIALDGLVDEFQTMKRFLKNALTADVAKRICEKSGSHLIKLVSPRVDGDHATLRFDDHASNRRSGILPSVNAPDIPFCKVVFRPLEVKEYAVMSVIDHILNPDTHSKDVLGAFAFIFGDDVLKTMQSVLLSPAKIPSQLGAGEFPIIFVPRPGGGDLQITPVSPANAFMGMKRVSDRYFKKATSELPRPPRGRWIKQAISAKPQNISGAIGGPRLRFLATMPQVMGYYKAGLYRYVQGGAFPRWHDDDVASRVLRYADMLESDKKFNNQDTRAALDHMVERIIADACSFIQEVLDDAADMSPENLSAAPTVQQVLTGLRKRGDPDYGRAVNALTSPHFEDRLRKSRKNLGVGL